METALFINGVYEVVLDEIIKSQEKHPGGIFFLQPYSTSAIKQLKDSPPTPRSPTPLYLSTTGQLNQICYTAEIVGWEDKNHLSPKRLSSLNHHMKTKQPKEATIYFEVRGKTCVNLISIKNLRKLANALSVTNLTKESDGKPLKNRTRAGGWSYVYALPLLEIENSLLKERLDLELEQAVSRSMEDDDESRNRRLAKAPKIPEKVQTISFDFKRNPDVIAAVVKRADGKCELCKLPAPFTKASNGAPYLEVHHWYALSEGGEDTVKNAAALCPNCHKQAHFGVDKEYIKSNKALKNDGNL